MTTSEPSRLDRIEMLLGNLAERQDRFQAQQEISQSDSTARLNRIEQSNQDSVARLDRIEQLNENTARLIESNARAIAAHGEELRTSMATYREELTSSLAAHRQEFRNNISDVVNMVGEIANPVAENNAQIEVLIGESRENAKQHQSFQERFDRVLGEIRALWQRIGRRD